MMTKVNLPFVRTPYNYDVDKVSNDNGLDCPEPTLAQQHCKEECDINYIVERFGVTGQLPPNDRPMPTYGDFTGISDYRSALDAVMAADDVFMSLPPKIRERFANDPAALVDFCSDDSNRAEAMELGLIPPSAPQERVSIPEPTGFTGTPEA